MPQDIAETVFETLTSEDTREGCDLKSGADAAEPKNFLRHIGALSASKLADGLVDPKLVLSWLMTALAAPAFLVGLLVPIREAGALLPQLFTAARIHATQRRKWAWAAGAAGQGLSAGAILLAALTLKGWVAGLAICAALAVLAISRSVCSVSYKDVLGKTVGKTRRGQVTGLASSVASAGVIVFAALLLWTGDRMGLVLLALGVAASLWLLASLIFLRLHEAASDVSGPDERGALPLDRYREIWRCTPSLRRFVWARALLVSTALAPPYLVLMASGGDGALSQLGALVLASAGASLSSSYVWGRFADRSSRQVLMAAGLMATVAFAAAVALASLGLLSIGWVAPAVLFIMMIAYHGVRQGRSTWLVDFAPEDCRADYTAIANTAIGVLLLASGVVGALAAVIGPSVTMVLFALLALGGAYMAYRLPEVETA